MLIAITTALLLAPSARPSIQGAPAGAVSVGEAQREDPTRYVRSLVEESGTPLSELQILPPQPPSAQVVAASGLTYLVTVQMLPSAVTGLTPAARLYEVTLHPGTGFVEKFLVSPGRPGKPRPMLVAFHRFGVSHHDIDVNTDFIEEAQRRGWHLVAPLGASGVHFSSIESQVNTEAVLNWMVAHFDVDPKRVYGVGFSMGGGAALNYAARHLDPAGVMFAAVVNHTGVIDLNDVYVNEPNAQFIFDYWFGNGTPGSADTWQLERSSVIHVDPLTSLVDPTADLARNLMGLTTRTVHATNDPLAYLMVSNDLLWAHLQALGAGSAQHVLYVIPFTGHSWDLLDERATCDWLRTQRLRLPRAGSTLADRDATYYHFQVEQDASGAFTPFDWELDTPTNSVAITGTRNLRRITIDTPGASLSTTTPLGVMLATADSIPDEVAFRRWTSIPSNVTRDGIATTSWTYDAQAQRLTLIETDGGSHVWQVVP